MLTPDVRFEGWTTEGWRRFVRLWKPRAQAPDDAQPRGGIIAIHDGTAIRKLLHTQHGRLAPPPRSDALPILDAGAFGAAGLADLAAQHHASWALGARIGALDEVMERFGERARRGDDMTVQALKLVAIVREMTDEGALESWPRRLRGVPVPSAAVVDRAIDALCGDGRAIALGMFQGGELWTAFVARRRGTGFDVIAGPDELRPDMGLLSGDWRRDYRHLVRVVEERYAPLAFGCFADVSTFLELQLDARPGAWSRAVAVRDVILSPIPSAVGLALGLDGARYAFEQTRGITSQIDALGLIDPLLARVRRRLAAAAGDKDLAALLGFDPLAALRALLQR